MGSIARVVYCIPVSYSNKVQLGLRCRKDTQWINQSLKHSTKFHCIGYKYIDRKFKNPTFPKEKIANKTAMFK